jgi:hypothetical protein
MNYKSIVNLILRPMSVKTKSFLIVFGLIVSAACVEYFSASFAQGVSMDKMVHLRLADSILKTSLDKSQDPNLAVLKNQYAACREIKRYYNGLATAYFQNYFGFSVCSVLFTALLAIASFLVVNDGWQKADPLLKTFFLTTVLISSFYFFLASVIENKKNVETNLNKAKTFETIQLNILSDANNKNLANADTLNKFIRSNYSDIADNLDLVTTDINTDELGGNPTKNLKGLKK